LRVEGFGFRDRVDGQGVRVRVLRIEGLGIGFRVEGLRIEG